MTTDHKSSEKIDEALALLNEAARDKKEELEALLEGKYADVKNVLKNMEANVEEHAIHGMDTAKHMRHQAGETLKETADHVDHVVRQDPWKTLGWGVAGAFLVGYLCGHKE